LSTPSFLIINNKKLMSLIFNDTLDTTDGSGLYTLMAYVNGEWMDIHTISGARSGETRVDGQNNKIDVDSLLFAAGQWYNFKWVDSNGAQSNIRSILMPADAYGYSDTAVGIGAGNLVTLDLQSLSQAANGYISGMAYFNVPIGGSFSLQDTSDGTTFLLTGVTAPVSGNNLSFITDGLFAGGHTYRIIFYGADNITTYSNTLTAIPTAPAAYAYAQAGTGIGAGNLSQLQLAGLGDDGSGHAVFAARMSIAVDGSIALEDKDSALTGSPISISGPFTSDIAYDFSGGIPFIIGHHYRMRFTDTLGHYTYSDLISAEDIKINSVVNGTAALPGILQVNVTANTAISNANITIAINGYPVTGITNTPCGIIAQDFNSDAPYRSGDDIQLVMIDLSSGHIVAASLIVKVP
jgi:hypothetical protein